MHHHIMMIRIIFVSIIRIHVYGKTSMGNDEKTNANANALVFRNRLLDKTKTLNVPKLAPKSSKDFLIEMEE